MGRRTANSRSAFATLTEFGEGASSSPWSVEADADLGSPPTFSCVGSSGIVCDATASCGPTPGPAIASGRPEDMLCEVKHAQRGAEGVVGCGAEEARARSFVQPRLSRPIRVSKTAEMMS